MIASVELDISFDQRSEGWNCMREAVNISNLRGNGIDYFEFSTSQGHREERDRMNKILTFRMSKQTEK